MHRVQRILGVLVLVLSLVSFAPPPVFAQEQDRVRAAVVAGALVSGALVLATGTIRTCNPDLHMKRDQENRCVPVEHTPLNRPYSLAQATPDDPIAHRRTGRIVGGIALIGSGVVLARFWPTGVRVDASSTRLSVRKSITW